MSENIFEIKTPLGFLVRCSRSYWEFIVSQKHPVLRGHEADVIEALTNPDEIRKSRKDGEVFLFYCGSFPRWLCAVAKTQGGDGFLITAYPTDAIKVGDIVWKK